MVSRPTFQASPTPRFENFPGGYGANINYNMPPKRFQAGPRQPVSGSPQQIENYGPPSCGSSGIALEHPPPVGLNKPPSSLRTGDYYKVRVEAQDQTAGKSPKLAPEASLPVGTMVVC